ncbi:MAG: hypothetical protein EU548_04760 [Promethearchaeota archaeon]|nr:MAG: hypothetical protein EU548_04760 [Candidatus Lokiarchaeota archaeon]
MSRNIYLVIQSYQNWDIKNKHSNFYSGSNPEELDLFILDEWMLLRGVYGIKQKTLKLNGTEEIVINEKTYDCYEFIINETFGSYVAG